jgi:hypothetical protein
MTTSNMRCSLSRLFPGATVARSGKEDCDGSGTINVWSYVIAGWHAAHMVSRWDLQQCYKEAISVGRFAGATAPPMLSATHTGLRQSSAEVRIGSN